MGGEHFIAVDANDFATSLNGYSARLAFSEQHSDNLLGGTVTEELTQLLFMVGYAVFFHQINKVLGSVTSQGRDTKIWVLGPVVAWGRRQIGEVAAPAAGN